jgi:hypothetical protein
MCVCVCIREHSGNILGLVQGTFREHSGKSVGLHPNLQEALKEITKVDAEYNVGTFRGNLGHIQGTFRERYGSFREHSRSQGTFRGHSGTDREHSGDSRETVGTQSGNRQEMLIQQMLIL